MFPLSYPATAKTLMSKYGLLDIENYQQRKELQFDRSIAGVKYPASPVYCGIENAKQIAVLIQTDETPLNLDNVPLLTRYENHYDISSSADSAALSVLFGLPELYHPALSRHTPLLLDLPSKLGLNVSLYSDRVINHAEVANFTQNWLNFSSSLNKDSAKLAIGFVNGDQLKSILSDDLLATHKVLVTKLAQQRDSQRAMPLYSNIGLQKGLSSNEDIAATVLNQLGCAANEENYSTGQNLKQPRRNWLVSTQGSKVVVMHDSQRIEVLSNGNYKIYDRQSASESVKPLNTGLLSQAIKHLSRFH